MKKFEKIYKDLSKTYNDDEIADAMVIPEDLSSEEEAKAKEELLAFRFKMIQEQTEEERIYSDLIRFKFQMEEYIQNAVFSPEKTFGKHLEEYTRILKRTKKQLSIDLDVHYTRLSRIFNDREEPNVELTYRLEKHCDHLIPAIYWWKLMIKKQEARIKKDSATRKEEASKVTNGIKFRA